MQFNYIHASPESDYEPPTLTALMKKLPGLILLLQVIKHFHGRSIVLISAQMTPFKWFSVTCFRSVSILFDALLIFIKFLILIGILPFGGDILDIAS